MHNKSSVRWFYNISENKTNFIQIFAILHPIVTDIKNISVSVICMTRYNCTTAIPEEGDISNDDDDDDEIMEDSEDDDDDDSTQEMDVGEDEKSAAEQLIRLGTDMPSKD